MKQVWRILTLACNEASQLVSEGRDRELTRLERTALKAHLVGCTKCKRYRRHLEMVAAALSKTEPLGPDAKNRIREAVAKHSEPGNTH